MTGMSDVVWLADPALPLPVFAAAEREVVSRLPVAGRYTAIVRRKNNDRIVGQSEAVQRIEYFSDGDVQRLDHSTVDWMILNLTDRGGAIDDESAFRLWSPCGLPAVLLPQLRCRL